MAFHGWSAGVFERGWSECRQGRKERHQSRSAGRPTDIEENHLALPLSQGSGGQHEPGFREEPLFHAACVPPQDSPGLSATPSPGGCALPSRTLRQEKWEDKAPLSLPPS